MTLIQRRAGIVETWLMGITLFFLITGVPWAWFDINTAGNSTAGGDLATSALFIALAGGLAVFMNGWWRQFVSFFEKEPILLLFLAWIVASTVWSTDMGLSLRRAAAILVTTYIGAHLVMRFNQFHLVRVLSLVLTIVVFLNLFWIVALPQYGGPPSGGGVTGDAFGFEERLTGIFDSPNTLGRIMALSVFTLLAALKLDRRRRPLYLSGLVAAGVVLALSQSKTALVASLLTSSLMVLFMMFRARRTLFGAVVVSVTSATAISMYVVASNFTLLTDQLDRESNLSGRIPLWEGLLERSGDYLPFGAGYSGYWNGWGSPAHEIWNINRWFPPHGHNQFLDILLELGIPGLLLYSALLISLFKYATIHIRETPGVFGLWPLTFATFFLMSTLTESAVVSRDILWALLVSAILLTSRSKEKAKAQRSARPAPSPQLQNA